MDTQEWAGRTVSVREAGGRHGVIMDKAPYEDVDPEVRRLVRLVNSFPGLHTAWSCAGHAEGEETYVTFRAESQEDLCRLASALPPLGARAGVYGNEFRWSNLALDVALAPPGQGGALWYTLRVAGRPWDCQRRLVGEVEGALATHGSPAHTPPPSELLAPQELADAAPFYLVLREYIRQLKGAREAAGLTLAEVSARSGLAVESLSRLEAGAQTNPAWKTLGAYAAAVGRKPRLLAEPPAPAG